MQIYARVGPLIVPPDQARTAQGLYSSGADDLEPIVFCDVDTGKEWMPTDDEIDLYTEQAEN